MIVDRDPHRHALDDLNPVAGRVLGRQDRKFAARAAADACDMAGQRLAGVGVERDRRGLADAHMIEVGFLEIGVDPVVVADQQAHRRNAQRDDLARLDLRRLAGEAVGGGAHGRPSQVERRLVVCRQRRKDKRVAVDRPGGGATEHRGRIRLARLRRAQLGPGLAQRVFGLLQPRARREAVLHQVLLALEVDRGIADRLALAGDIGALARKGRAHPRYLRAGVRKVGIGLLERDAVRFGIDGEQHLPALDAFAFTDTDRDDAPGDVAADRHLVLSDISIVGRHRASGGEQIIRCRRNEQQWNHQHQQRAAGAHP